MYQSRTINPPLIGLTRGPFPLSKASFHTHAWNSSRAALCPIACFGSRQENRRSYWKACLSDLGFGHLICRAVAPMGQLCLECQADSGPCIAPCHTSERLGQYFVPLRRESLLRFQNRFWTQGTSVHFKRLELLLRDLTFLMFPPAAADVQDF